MTILKKALGPNPPECALTRLNIVRDLIDEKKIEHDTVTAYIKGQEQTLIDLEYDAVLSAASKDDVREARALLDELRGEERALNAVVKDLSAELPKLEEAAKAQEAKRAAEKKAALAGQKTIAKRIDAALDAQEAYKAAVEAAQAVRDEVINKVAADCPDAARMIRADEVPEAIQARGREELEAAAEGITIQQYDFNLGRAKTDTAKRLDEINASIEAAIAEGEQGQSVFQLKRGVVEPKVEEIPAPKQSVWDENEKQWVYK